jgi:hypothetical protein
MAVGNCVSLESLRSTAAAKLEEYWKNGGNGSWLGGGSAKGKD